MQLAKDDIKNLIKLEPTNYRACYNLANLYYMSNGNSKAEATMLQGLQLQPSSQ